MPAPPPERNIPMKVDTKPRSNSANRAVYLVDDEDADQFRQANTEFMKTSTSSQAEAIEALKKSGYLDESGQISERYKD